MDMRDTSSACAGSKASKTMLMSLFGSLRRQRDAVMPQVTSQLGVAKSHGI